MLSFVSEIATGCQETKLKGWWREWEGGGELGGGGGRSDVPMICPSLKNITIFITYIVSREVGHETLQVSKAITKALQFKLKVLRPCTIFYGFYWL